MRPTPRVLKGRRQNPVSKTRVRPGYYEGTATTTADGEAVTIEWVVRQSHGDDGRSWWLVHVPDLIGETDSIHRTMRDAMAALDTALDAGFVRGRYGWSIASTNPSADHVEYRDRPRAAIIMVHGAKGDNRLIRKILTEEIKRVIGKKRWHPRNYMGVAEMSAEYGEYEPARFSIDVTDDEMDKIMDASVSRFIEAGWRDGEYPIEVYHD